MNSFKVVARRKGFTRAAIVVSLALGGLGLASCGSSGASTGHHNTTTTNMTNTTNPPTSGGSSF
jgi:hypothetical protein